MKKLFLALLLSVSVCFGGTAVVAAAPTDGAKQTICAQVNQVQGTCGDTSGVKRVIAAAINILSIIVGVAAVIMIVIAGMKYVTSGGDSSSIASAKNTLIYAIVGLIVTALAQFIVRFVLGSVGVPTK
jgi:hypothetical protein